MIEARDIRFTYHKRPVLTGVNLSLSEGEFVCLLGANGAGKSTLLKVMLGLLAPTGGTVSCNGKPLGSLARRRLSRILAYVPQIHSTPFPYTVRNVALMGRLPVNGFLRNPCPQDHDIVDHVLCRLGIMHLADRSYTEISGGERQLTLIARALVQEARLLILDEPLAGLDYGHQLGLLELLDDLVEDGYGLLMTTHDPDRSLSAGHRVALLVNGRIVADGASDKILTPQAIHRLYGVRVDLQRTPDGQAIAFKPVPRPR